jgi:hypothetical protein
MWDDWGDGWNGSFIDVYGGGKLEIGAGTYWIELFNDTSGSLKSWFWEADNQDPLYGIAGQAHTSNMHPLESWWLHGSTDMAFELICE